MLSSMSVINFLINKSIDVSIYIAGFKFVH